MSVRFPSRWIFAAVSLTALLVTLVATKTPRLLAADLVLELSGARTEIRFVGAIRRWESDGNPRRPVDPRARIDSPQVDLIAKKIANDKWVCAGITPGRYDLILLGNDHLRIDGFHYPPVLEFDPFLPHTESAPGEAVEWIRGDIAKARHYENKVAPLFFAGDGQQIRVLVQLVRDESTSFDAEFGQPVATLRHEVWLYTNRYGAWSKEKRTRVLDRVLMAKGDLSHWTWVWEPQLGAVEIEDQTRTVRYSLPNQFAADAYRGLIADRAAPRLR